MKVTNRPGPQAANRPAPGIAQLNQRIRALIAQRSYAAAEILIRQAIAQEPRFIKHRQALAKTLMAQKKYQQALEAIDEALSLTNNSWLLAQSTIIKAKIVMRQSADHEACARLLVEAAKADFFNPRAVAEVRAVLEDFEVPLEALDALDLVIRYRSDSSAQEFERAFSQQLVDCLKLSSLRSPAQMKVKIAIDTAFRAVDRSPVKGKHIHKAAARIRSLNPDEIIAAIQGQLIDPSQLMRIYSTLISQRLPRDRMPHVDWTQIEPAVEIIAKTRSKV